MPRPSNEKDKLLNSAIFSVDVFVSPLNVFMPTPVFLLTIQSKLISCLERSVTTSIDASLNNFSIKRE